MLECWVCLTTNKRFWCEDLMQDEMSRMEQQGFTYIFALLPQGSAWASMYPSTDAIN